MEKVLKLYKYIDGKNDTPFPNVEYQAVVSDFRYDVKRMGGAPIITCTVMHTLCLDKLWSDNVYAYFNGERFFIKQIPTSSYSNTDSRYKHELELVSERFVLDNVYFYDVVDSSENNDKPVSNSSKFSFFGDINEFASRLNQSLQYSNVDYSVVVDDGISSEAKMVSFQDQFFSGAIQEGYNTYNVPFYFEGKVIHFGYTNNAITRTFRYGKDESLLSIQKQNANHKIVNRVTGVGSSDNIPYYYPNDDEKGETEVLYNNKKDIAYVSNQSKYKKVKLSDIFKYSYAESYNKTLVDEKGRSSNGYLVLVGENVFEIGNVTYPFKIESLSDTMFGINYLGDNLVDIKIDVFRGSEQLMSTSQIGSFSRRYREGNYELRITLHVHIEGVNIESEVNVDDVLKDISLHVYQQTEYKDSWLLNDGEKVNLFDYGLSINGTQSDGDTITFKRVGYIQPQTNLMPSIYRESLGKERFYEALNNAYQIPGGDEYYEFENPYIEGKPKEHIVNFDYIKPTIKGITNSEGLRIDMFIDFAYDENDNDETKIVDGEEVYAHPYFFAKLRKFDGQFGFNLFDHAIDEGEMTISMTSGSCGACNLIVQVNEENKNTVQVDSNGNLKRGDNGDVLFGEPQDRQNDTIHNEVWVALKKDTDTFGVIMPNASKNYRPSTNDTFVILHIDLPKAYILAAEDKLKEELIKYMSLNNSEKFNFSISFSRIFFAENPNILEQLNENARIQIEYDNTTYELYISSYSYSMSKDVPLPEIRIELSDTLTISQNALQTAIGDVKNEILSSIGGSANIDILKQGLRYFLRKDKDDRTPHNLGVGKNLLVGESVKVGDFVEGTLGSGASTFMRGGSSYSEVDFLKVRKKATFTNITIQELKHVGGEIILSPAAMVVSNVEETEDGYKCYFDSEDSDGRKIYNEFELDDLARCQTFNLSPKGADDLIGNHYYWRKVIEVGENFIVLSKKEFEYDDNSDIPQVGDNICQLGNTTNTQRQAAIILSAFGSDAPSYKQYNGIDSFSLEGKQVTKLSPYGNELTGILNVEAGSKGAGNLEDLPSEIFDAVHIGSVNLLLNSGFTGDHKVEELNASYALNSGSELFSRGMKHWAGDATLGDDSVAVSGKSAVIGSLSQSVQLMKDEGYVVSFKAKGVSVKVMLGGSSVEQRLGTDYTSYSFKFVSDGVGSFSISGDATICDLQLERGTIATDWHASPYDNDKTLAEFQALKYIQDAIREGDTTILGGLILSSMIQLGNYKNGKMEKVNAGVSGVYNDDNDVAFWGGGTFEQAIKTLIKFKQNPNYNPSETEWRDLANFVVSHGGDLIIRGYIYALGGFFRGEINAESGVFKNVKSPNGSFSIDEYGNVKIIGTFETSVNGTRIKIDAETNQIVLYDDLGRETAVMNFHKDVGEIWTYGTMQLTRYERDSNVVANKCVVDPTKVAIIDNLFKYESVYRSGFAQMFSTDGKNALITLAMEKKYTSTTPNSDYNWITNLQMSNLPKSASEVAIGGVYNDGGVLKIKN